KMNSKFDFKSIISSQSSVMGDLHRLLRQGEYAPFTCAPIFESKFVQVNRRGDPISIHNRPICVTIGICADNPGSPMPNVMLVAHKKPVSTQEIMTKSWKPSEQPSHVEQLVLSRFLPLQWVELSVHSTDKHHLMLRLVNGRCYYLELCAPPDQQEHLFHQWLQLIFLLNPPENASNTKVQRDDQQAVPNAKTEREFTKKTSSKQVPLSGRVGPTEEIGRKGQVFYSFLKRITAQSKKSTGIERAKPHISGKAGNENGGSKSSRLFQVISQTIRNKSK
ncbi:PREDICTED: protein FAM71D-like, partial [Buceros rhinoceros silvestris]|uniref:protein FAM71D-like n=1 Tax=Buceros rhinoceros silvestris TaxID=175836 RepID=UPI000528FED7